jgi:hypothetical protein
VIVMLSEDFIRKKHPMAELQLLMERHSKDGVHGTKKAVVMPVFYRGTLEKLSAAATAYGASKDEQQRQWQRDLAAVMGITGHRIDQVRRTLAYCTPSCHAVSATCLQACCC